MAVRLTKGQMTVFNVNDGKQGNPGADAPVVTVSPASLAFNAVTDSSGNCKASTSSGNTAQVAVMQGGKDVGANCKFYVSAAQNCTASVSGSGLVTVSAIATDTVNGRLISKTSASVVVRVVYAGVNYYVSLPVAVSVSAMWGGLKSDMSGLQSQYTSLANDLKGTNPTVLAKYTSTIKQAARDISLEVSQKTVGRRNLLVGSAFRKQDEGVEMALCGNMGSNGIQISGGIDGVNCLKVTSYNSDGTTAKCQYAGAFWRASSASRNVRIKRNTKYTFSCWVKCNRTDVTIALETIYKESENTTARATRPASTTSNFRAKAANVWELVQCTITTGADYDYIEANVWTCHELAGVSASLCICRPMLEEGDTYNGWTLSEQDYDYVGGNLLDNARTLTVMGNLDQAYGVTQNAYGTSCAVAHVTASSSSYHKLLLWKTASIELVKGQDYMLSFLAKGSGQVAVYMYDNSPRLYVEGSDGQLAIDSYDGCCKFNLSAEWKRCWVHWRITGSNLPRYVLIRASNGADVYVTQPKLEEGATVTEWTERKTDLVDKATAKAAGMEITSSGVTLYGDKIMVKNGSATAALFTGGKLNSAFIDADKIEVKHLWAKSSDGSNIVGHFGNYEESACKLDDGTLAPLFVGGETAKKSPFYVTSKGHMVSTSATLGNWSLKPGSLDYDGGYGEMGMTLTNTYQVFREYERAYASGGKATYDLKRRVWVGGLEFPSLTYDKTSCINIEDSFTKNGRSTIGVYASVEGSNDSVQESDYIYNGKVEGKPFGNFAIWAEKGMYAGFRPMSRVGKYSQTLSHMDFLIHVDGGSGQTFTLPASPQRGQMYWFLHSQAGSFKINGNGKNLYAPAAGNPTGNLTFNTPGELLVVWFDGSIWRVVWTKGRWD